MIQCGYPGFVIKWNAKRNATLSEQFQNQISKS